MRLWYSVRQLAPPDAGTLASIASIAGAVGVLGRVVLVGIVGAAVFHGLSALFDGEGPFRRTPWLTGWGYLPAVLSGVVLMFALILAADAVPAAEATYQHDVRVLRHDLDARVIVCVLVFRRFRPEGHLLPVGVVVPELWFSHGVEGTGTSRLR